jgi:hypothetical protein
VIKVFLGAAQLIGEVSLQSGSQFYIATGYYHVHSQNPPIKYQKNGNAFSTF